MLALIFLFSLIVTIVVIYKIYGKIIRKKLYLRQIKKKKKKLHKLHSKFSIANLPHATSNIETSAEFDEENYLPDDPADFTNSSDEENPGKIEMIELSQMKEKSNPDNSDTYEVIELHEVN